MPLPSIKHAIGSWYVRKIPFSFPDVDSGKLGLNSGAQSSDQQSWHISTSVTLLADIPIIARAPIDIPPTFGSAVAPRQYSLVLWAKISGAKVKDFRLEVPLQIVYDMEKGRDKYNSYMAKLLPGRRDSSIQHSSHEVSELWI
ncbi:uncharacterized protein A1O5_12439 [Cladophialophora psammophila CBS 110553]|uniref:Uncharacterized protein n=1 Tax=Cladophialophora psammophila CBS 110553 TaxID=1182543 RepID=W9WGK7_9EURO|nr:uncharacterized protein A1O5_12439 [Cladophialophora psammophila CBS 110553]EXJ57649.1 hypothetical protein A1O5_12439 [Cladophialophora psammophila CBS 110553]